MEGRFSGRWEYENDNFRSLTLEENDNFKSLTLEEMATSSR